MAGLLAMLLVGAGILVIAGLVTAVRSGGRSRTPAKRTRGHDGDALADAPTTRISMASLADLVPDQRMPFAEPGMRGPLFQYGGERAGFVLDAPFAILDIETTGLSPATGDRVVEIAIARIDRYGRLEDQYATLLNPGRDVGPVFSHGISNIDVRDAPRFDDVAGELLALMDGAIVVAHNAVFQERFLAAEMARAGILPPVNPALCSLWLARQTMRTPNHRLRTLARYAGLPSPDGHTALGDVHLLAALLPQMLDAYGQPLRFACGFTPMPYLEVYEPARTREAEPRKGGSTWTASLIARLPGSATEATDVDAQRYLEVLALALTDGRILGHEAPEVARLAASAGLLPGGRRAAAPAVPGVDARVRAGRRHPHHRGDPAAARRRRRRRLAGLLRRAPADLAGGPAEGARPAPAVTQAGALGSGSRWAPVRRRLSSSSAPSSSAASGGDSR